jgi:hypothetical protein
VPRVGWLSLFSSFDPQIRRDRADFRRRRPAIATSRGGGR